MVIFLLKEIVIPYDKLFFKTTQLHDLLLYDFNLYFNLPKKPLLERAKAYKKFVRQFQIPQKNNSKIQILKLLKDQKNIKESDDLRLRNYWNKTVGLKDLAKPSPFHIKPKAHAEEEEMPDDEWRESRLPGYTAKDDPVLDRPKS